jgi:hypothetical protein
MSVIESHGTIRLPRRTICLAVCAVLTVACTPKTRAFQVGERAQVGGAVYTVLDTEWTGELNQGGEPPLAPKHRFLIVHLNINNAGSKEITIPLLHVVDASGGEHLELSEIKGMPDWYGILRALNPTESKEGRIVFDVPVGAYNLRVTDGAEQESERTALVVLPPGSKTSLDSPLLNQPKTQD